MKNPLKQRKKKRPPIDVFVAELYKTIAKFCKENGHPEFEEYEAPKGLVIFGYMGRKGIFSHRIGTHNVVAYKEAFASELADMVIAKLEETNPIAA